VLCFDETNQKSERCSTLTKFESMDVSSQRKLHEVENGSGLGAFLGGEASHIDVFRIQREASSSRPPLNQEVTEGTRVLCFVLTRSTLRQQTAPSLLAQQRRVYQEGILHRNMKQFRDGLAFKAHRLLYYSTLGLRVSKKERRVPGCCALS
jgi:hypothetical protein